MNQTVQTFSMFQNDRTKKGGHLDVISSEIKLIKIYVRSFFLGSKTKNNFQTFLSDTFSNNPYENKDVEFVPSFRVSKKRESSEKGLKNNCSSHLLPTNGFQSQAIFAYSFNLYNNHCYCCAYVCV